MNTDTMVLLTGLIGTVMVTGLLGAAIAGAYFFGRSRGAQSPIVLDGGESRERLARIERLLCDLTIEVERLGESSRHARMLQPPLDATRGDPTRRNQME